MAAPHDDVGTLGGADVDDVKTFPVEQGSDGLPVGGGGGTAGAGQGKSRDRRQGAATPFSEMWEEVDLAISNVIDKTTFADLLRTWQEKQNKYVLNWEI